MVRVQDKQDVDCALDGWIWPIAALRHRVKHHVEKIFCIRQIIVRIDVGQARAVPVRERCYRGHLGDGPVRLKLSGIRIGNVLGIGIERRKGSERAKQHPHRVGIVLEPFHELLDVLMQHGVGRNVVRPLVELTRSGQLAVDDEVGRFQESGLLGELLDRVATIPQYPLGPRR